MSTRVSCLNVYLTCCSDTFQAPKLCVASVVILHLLRLVGDGRVSNVEARQNGLRLTSIAIKVVQKNSC